MDRRQILKAAGVASTIPALSATGVAVGDERNDSKRGKRECPQPQCIHPVLGYSGFSPDERLPEPLRPDHEVDLLIRPRDGAPIPEFIFQPTGLFVESGDVVRFNLETPDHTVTAYHPRLGRQRRVPEGVPSFSSPVLGGGTFWLYRFDEPGVYDLLCAPHEIFGMVMRIVVDEPTADFGPAGEVEMDGDAVELRGPEFTAALVFDDPMLAPETIARERAVPWEDLQDENKRLLLEVAEPPEG